MKPLEFKIVDSYWVGTAGLSSDKFVVDKTNLPVIIVDDSTGAAFPEPQIDPTWIESE